MSKNYCDPSICDSASFDLNRFIKAQSSIYDTALAEIYARQKRTHWMWFIFPQLRGLGSSATSNHYGIDGIGEARDFLKHPLLGSRLIECTQAMNNGAGFDIRQILGDVDSEKFRSCATLFAKVAVDENCFKHAIEQFFGGAYDQQTIRIIEQIT